MPFEFAFARKPLATALIIGGFLALSAPAAHAQFFNFFFHNEGLDPGDVQSMLEDRGLALTRPLHRNGGVYVADVEGPRGMRQRLIIDAESGRIVQRFRIGAPPRYYDYAQRPPADTNEPFGVEPNAPPAVITYGQSVARSEDAPAPNIVTVPNEEKPKIIRPQIKRKKIELTPVPQPAQNAPAPAAPEPKQPAHAEAANPAPSAPEAKPAPVASPAPAPAAHTAAPSSKTKPAAINDVPVTPLD